MCTARSQSDHHVLIVDLGELAESAFAVDARRRIVFWNPAAQALLGFQADEVLERRCCDVLDQPDNATFACRQCVWPPTQSAGQPLARQFEAVVTTRTGERKQLHVTAVRAHTADGNIHIMHLLREAAAPGATERQPARGTLAAAGGDVPRPHLTQRELEVLQLLASGLSNGAIATALSISPITARNHVTRVIEKLEVNTRLQAVVVASRLGLL
ncbi:MAG: LuxR C-terminal-related transcriptional regulator [Ktedonobacterales bacterium]